jgi:hypothetical protein
MGKRGSLLSWRKRASDSAFLSPFAPLLPLVPVVPLYLTGSMRCAYGVPANMTYGTDVSAAVVG